MTKEKLNSYLCQTWLIGRLFRVGRSTYASALYEFLYLFLWSVLPFALGGLVLYVASDLPNKNYFLLSIDTFRNGELLVFTISMLAPILYLTLHDPELADPFPHKLPISTIVALVIVTCASLFALLKASAVKDIPFVFELSVVLTLMALSFRFLAIVYHKVRLPPMTERDLRAPQDNFVETFRDHLSKDTQIEKQDFARDFASHVKEQS